jgi:hypothetical protein
MHSKTPINLPQSLPAADEESRRRTRDIIFACRFGPYYRRIFPFFS